MSRVVRSQGIVLRSRPFRESSKIVSVLSRYSGKIDLLARGARKPGSRFGAALEMGTEAEFIYYERENKSLWTLSSADIVNSHQSLREDALRLNLLARVLKLLLHLSQPGETNPGLYNLTLAVLAAIGTASSPSALYELYLWRVSALSGYPPHIEEGCIVCGRRDVSNFSIQQGGLLCEKHSIGQRNIQRLNRDELRLLVFLSEISPSEVRDTFPSIVSEIIRNYTRYHLHADEDIIPSR